MRRGIGAAVEPDLELAGEEVHLDYRSPALGSLNESALLRGYLQKILLVVLLVFQAAHEPAAGAAYLDRIE